MTKTLTEQWRDELVQKIHILNEQNTKQYNELCEEIKKNNILEKQLAIATKALKQYSWGDNWLSGDCRGQVFLPTKYGYTIADEALDEIEEVKMKEKNYV